MIHNRKEIYFNTGCFAIDYDSLFNRIDYINTWAKNQNPSISPDTYKDLSIAKALYRRIIEGKQSSRFIKFKTVIGLNIFLLPSWLVLKDFARNPDRLQLWINSSIIFMENEFGKENIVKIFFNYENKKTFDNRFFCRLDFIIVPLLNGELPIRDSYDFQSGTA